MEFLWIECLTIKVGYYFLLGFYVSTCDNTCMCSLVLQPMDLQKSMLKAFINSLLNDSR